MAVGLGQVTVALEEPSEWISYEIESRIKERLAELEKAIEENDFTRDELNQRADLLRAEQRALFGAQQAIWKEAQS